MNQRIVFDLEHLRQVAVKIFKDQLYDVKENIYSSICAEIKITAPHILTSDFDQLSFHGYRVTLIGHNRLGFSIHVARIE